MNADQKRALEQKALEERMAYEMTKHGTKEFSLEQSRAMGVPTLYALGKHPRTSVLAGQQRRAWVEEWDSMESARAGIAALPPALRKRVFEPNGSTYIAPVVDHLPDDQ